MSDKKPADIENGISHLGNFLNEFAREIREGRAKREEKREQEKKRRRKIAEDYNNWLAKQEPKAKESTKIILDWVNQLLRSRAWRGLVSDYNDVLNRIDVSDDVTYGAPSNNPYHPYGTQGHQSLSLDFAGCLYVHNNVKYGKTYKIRNEKDMMKLVEPPIIIKIAETIEDGSIWSIIEKKIKWDGKRLARELKELEDLDLDDY